MLMGAPDGAVVETLKPFLLSTEQASGQRTQPESSLLVVVVFDRSLTLNAFLCLWYGYETPLPFSANLAFLPKVWLTKA